MDGILGTWIADGENNTDESEFAKFLEMAGVDEEWQKKMKDHNKGMKMIFGRNGDEWTHTMKTMDDAIIRENTLVLDKECDIKTVDGRDAKITIKYKDGKFHCSTKIKGIDDTFISIYELKGDNKLACIISVPSKDFDGPTMNFTKA
ncbi:fatty acid-binding protein, liver-like [Tubulanus polymorphus]|uniref:fatty acid-binding protein, liver-like n=1 Tax=Tubulanus polymorphus TaxID=672921 RepID=UPI003DA374EE